MSTKALLLVFSSSVLSHESKRGLVKVAIVCPNLFFLLHALGTSNVHSDLFGPSPHSSSCVQMRKELDLTGAGGRGAGRLDDSGSH